ncbi:MAG: HNH endonuclease [Chloroflexi bacterium]|nr:HNH endonuclease [Chloroflexota bacterium]
MTSKMVKGTLTNLLGSYCQGCGLDPRVESVELQIDHMSPRADGGPDNISNLTLLCPGCNQKKSSHLTLAGLRAMNRKGGHMVDEARLHDYRKHGNPAITRKVSPARIIEYSHSESTVRAIAEWIRSAEVRDSADCECHGCLWTMVMEHLAFLQVGCADKDEIVGITSYAYDQYHAPGVLELAGSVLSYMGGMAADDPC